MIKLKNLIPDLLFYSITILNVILLANYTSLGGFCYLFGGAILIISALYFLFENKINKIKFDHILCPIITVFVIASIVGIFLNASEMNILDTSLGETRILISNESKFQFAFITLIEGIVIYLTYHLFMSHDIQEIRFKILYYIFLIILIFIIAFSFIKESYNYICFLKGEEFDGIRSIFPSSSYLATIMIIGIMVVFLLNLKEIRLWKTIVMIAFGFIIYLTKFTPAFYISLLIIPAFWLFASIKRFLLRPISGCISLCGCILLIGLFYLFNYLCYKFNLPFISNFFKPANEYFSINIFALGKENMDYFFSYWNVVSTESKYIALGRGFGISNYIGSSVTQQAISDFSFNNSLISIFANFGVMGIILFTLGIIYYAYSCIKLFLKGSFFKSIAYLAIIVIIIFYSFYVDIFSIFLNGINFFFVVLLLLPPMVINKQKKNKDKVV